MSQPSLRWPKRFPIELCEKCYRLVTSNPPVPQ